MPENEVIIAKGNRLTELKDAKCVAVVGYRLYTGDEGQETSDASFCGARPVEYLKSDHPGLRSVPQFAHTCPEHPDWDCWLIVESTGVVIEAACETPSTATE